MLSSRLPADLTPNAVAAAVARRRSAGLALLDLTESNPTCVGLDYPSDLLAALGDPAGLAYEPHPLGAWRAREAVSGDYARQGLHVAPERVTLTASTSEAYSLLFKLFCNPGDGVLVPQPSYPLFDHLTRLEGVESAPYHLDYHGAWRIDLDSVTGAITPRSRALLVVSPNNPTGSCLHRDDLASLVRICAAHDVALIGDEVFADYRLDPAPSAVRLLTQDDVLSCALGGLSKAAGLPQAKLAWVAWGGPEADVDRALQAYEIMADNYLSVSTPVQVAAPSLLERSASVREQIRQRLARNLGALREACHIEPAVAVLGVEGGWSAVLRVPAVQSEEDLIVSLISQDGVLVHPGYFFDFPHEAFVVVSLIVDPVSFDRGIARVLARVSGTAA